MPCRAASPTSDNLDNIIDKLLEVRGYGSRGKKVQLANEEILYLITEARAIFSQQPTLLELDTPIKVNPIRLPITSDDR